MNSIICSAIYFNDGKEYVHQPKNIKVGFVICGYRHCSCFSIYRMVEGASLKVPYTQGFLTIYGDFVDREEAAKIAFKAGQIDKIKSELFSEDLYTSVKPEKEKNNV